MIENDFLQCHSLFGGLTADEMEKVRSFLKEESYACDADIVREGDPGGRVFFICHGSVDVLKQSDRADSTPETLATLQTGETFGEMEFIDVQPCVATVRAREDTRVLSLSHGDLYRIYKWNVKTFAMLVMNMARDISRRLRAMDARLAAMVGDGRSPQRPAGAPATGDTTRRTEG